MLNRLQLFFYDLLINRDKKEKQNMSNAAILRSNIQKYDFAIIEKFEGNKSIVSQLRLE